MALAPVDRFTGQSIYAPVAGVSRRQTPPEAGAVDRTAVAPRPVAPVETRSAVAPSAVESLTSSARAATVALAAVPREATESVDGARAAASDAEQAALAALADPLEAPSPRQVAENFAAVAALVPSPQQLANDALERSARSDRTVAASRAVADDTAGRDQPISQEATIGLRLSRFA